MRGKKKKRWKARQKSLSKYFITFIAHGNIEFARKYQRSKFAIFGKLEKVLLNFDTRLTQRKASNRKFVSIS